LARPHRVSIWHGYRGGHVIGRSGGLAFYIGRWRRYYLPKPYTSDDLFEMWRIVQPVQLVSKAEFCPHCGGKTVVSKFFHA